MRKHLGVLLPLGLFGVLGAACGKVEVDPDAATNNVDAPVVVDPDAAMIDAPETSIDAPTTSIDAAPIDAPSGPRPQLAWEGENNVNNTGTLTGYTLTTPAGVSYVAGKFGQAMMLASGQYTYVDGIRAPLSGYADVTIGWWMRESGATQGQAVIDCNNRSTAPYGGIQLGLSSSSVSVCVSSTSSSYLGGSCLGFTAPSANTWHHWTIRYDGSGTGTGQGGPVQIYVDNVLVHTRPNDGSNNPVFSNGITDRLYIGAFNMALDDVKIYNQVFSLADQCTYVVRGTWTGSSCTLP